MDSDVLFDYLQAFSGVDKAKSEYLRPEVDKRIFCSGTPNYPMPKRKLSEMRRKFRSILMDSYTLIRIVGSKNDHKRNSPKILSSSYFSVDSELVKHGFDVLRAPWAYGRKSRIGTLPSVQLFRKMSEIAKKLHSVEFSLLWDKEILEELEVLESLMASEYQKYDIGAFFCYSSYPENERMTINVLNRLAKPSFMFQHGLPGVYDSHMKFYDGSYHLVVWGERFKEKYLALGFDPDLIHVAGHPFYQRLESNELRFSFEDILIITKALPNVRVVKEVKLGDQNAVLLYLLSIKRVLEGLGVKRVRLRPHPSENKKWYKAFLDNGFFQMDMSPLPDSLRKATLVIGPTSTTFLEAAHYGVNYLVYEPTIDGITDLINYPIVMPFDGSDERIPVAYDESGLDKLLQERQRVDIGYWHDYMKTPFDVSFVKKFM